MNIFAFPKSANAYDSLAEAYMEQGDKESAIKYYEKSLSLNPDNINAKEMINKLSK
jgi:Tfp pilus assembly protein PilF